MSFLSRFCSSLIVIGLVTLAVSAQATPFETQVGTACANAAHSTDFDTLVQCTSTSASADTFRKAPLFVGAVASPPYPSTACDANKAGMLQYQGGNIVICDGSNWQSLAVSGSGSDIVGEVKIWPTGTVPSGYLECNGTAVSRTTYSALFAVLGTIYGAGDGSTTFNLPDYRGMFLRGWAHGSTTDPDAASRTNRGDSTTGDNIGTKQADAIKTHTNSVDPPSTGSSSGGSHSHTLTLNGTGGQQQPYFRSASGGWTAGPVTLNSAGSHSHTLNIAAFNSTYTGGNETRPVNIYVMYVIKY